MPSEDIKPKKRGRKPKNQISNVVNNKIEIKSEAEPLIAHLSINLKDIMEENETVKSTTIEKDSDSNYDLVTNSSTIDYEALSGSKEIIVKITVTDDILTVKQVILM